jgi:hypothetical protein
MSQRVEGRRLVRQPARVVKFGAPVVGFIYGGVVAGTFPGHAAPLWLVWAAFAVAATTAAGALFVYGLGRWRELNHLSAVSVREVVWPVMALVVVSLVLMNLTAFIPGPSHLDVRSLVGSRLGSGLVGMFAILAGIPAAGVMFGMWRVAGTYVPPGKRGGTVDWLFALRRLLQRLLAAAGSVVALVTFSAGTWWLLERSMHAQYANRPPQLVLVFGAFGSAFVGVVYGPAWTALQRRGRLLCDEMFPLGQLDRRADILKQATDRQKLEQMLGLDRSIIADLQGGLIILAPLLASAVAAVLPH